MSCVRCGGGFDPTDPAAAEPGGELPAEGGFGMLGISCVPGAFFAIGGGGLVPVPRGDELGALGGIMSPAACWKAPRCESALLTASGDTAEAGCGGGPYGVLAAAAREDGDAVAAKGFTGGPGGPYAVEGTLICGAGCAG